MSSSLFVLRAALAALFCLVATTGLPAAAVGETDDPALDPPEVNTSPGAQYADDARDMNMVLGMDRTPDGRIWAVWVSGGDSELGYFVAATSDDRGGTWSAPRLVIDPAGAWWSTRPRGNRGSEGQRSAWDNAMQASIAKRARLRTWLRRSVARRRDRRGGGAWSD